MKLSEKRCFLLLLWLPVICGGLPWLLLWAGILTNDKEPGFLLLMFFYTGYSLPGYIALICGLTYVSARWSLRKTKCYAAIFLPFLNCFLFFFYASEVMLAYVLSSFIILSGYVYLCVFLLLIYLLKRVGIVESEPKNNQTHTPS